jgi:hypothetical protein
MIVGLNREKMRFANLQSAIESLYFAAHWTPDRECDAAKLWEAVRDAAGIAPGQTAERLGKPRTIEDVALSILNERRARYGLDPVVWEAVPYCDRDVWLSRAVARCSA